MIDTATISSPMDPMASNGEARWSRRRVCLVSPRHLYANPRLVKEAAALSAAGCQVRIVCGEYAPFARAHDAALANPSWHISRVRFGPFEAPRLVYLKQTLRRHAARVLVRAGVADVRVAELAHAPAVPELMTAAAAEPADLYIAHYTAALPAAAHAAARHGVRYAYDVEDFHLGELPDAPSNALEKSIIRAIESRYLPGAAYVSAAAPLIADAYVDVYGIERPAVILNAFPRSNAPTQGSMARAEPGPSLYWFSQTIGPGRGLEAAITAIARASSKPHLYLRGDPAPGYERHLLDLADQNGVAARLHLMSPAPPSDLERLGAQYDLGYIGELAETKNRQIALTNKIFSYLCSGLPMAASDIPAHRDIAEDLSGAIALFAVDDPQSLADTVDTLLLDPARLAAARERAWRLGQERFCWEIEQRAFLEQVDAALAHTNHA